jgi:RHS repeat-associated protein
MYSQTLTNQNYKFTGKERDAESGLDNFGARYDSSALGRFMTPDWSAKTTAVPYADFGDPQTLNLYGYVRNNPLSKADLDGHGCFLGIGHCNNDPPPLPKKPFIPPAPFLKPNPVFKTVDQAATAAARADQKAQQQKGGENASDVFTVGKAGYTYTDPVTQGQRKTVDPNNTTGKPSNKMADLSQSPIPLGTQLVAESHSHPDNTGFSGEDIQRGHDLTIPVFGHPDFQGIYVGRPDDSVIKYDDKTGKQTTFEPGAPQ